MRLTESARPSPLALRLRAAVLGLDAGLRRLEGVRSFSTHPDCVLRISLASCRTAVVLADGSRVEPGDPVIDLHFWNERLASLPGRGVDWATPVSHRLVISMCELAKAIQTQSDLARARAVKAEMATALRRGDVRIRRFASHFGFAPVTETGSHAARERAEDLWLLALAWTFRPQTVPSRALIRRHEAVWISRDRFLERFARQASDGARASEGSPIKISATAPP